MGNKLSHRPAASPERLIVSAVKDKVSISLSDWIATQIIHGGTITDVRKTLMSALGQINRVEGYVAERGREHELDYRPDEEVMPGYGWITPGLPRPLA